MSGVLRVQAERLVLNGAEFLDHAATVQYPEIIPVRWHNVINLKILDVAWPMRCVLAQLGQESHYALLDYEATARALGMEPHPVDRSDDVIRLGFHAFPGDDAGEEHHYLTLAWKCLILRRRAADHPIHVRMALAS